MAATSGYAGSGNPDMALIGELMEEMSRHPPAVGARKLLIEHYIAVGWLEAAMENAQVLKLTAPGDTDVANFIQILDRKPEPSAPEQKTPLTPSASAVDKPEWDPKSGRYGKATSPKLAEEKPEVSSVVLGNDLDPARQELVTGYQAPRAKAGLNLADLMHLQALRKKAGLPDSSNTIRVHNNVERNRSGAQAPVSARSVAQSIRKDPKNATNLAVADLKDIMRRLREQHGQASVANNDIIRDALVKRKAATETALPEALKLHCELALMHLEHEDLGRNYANTETMYGDAVKDIARHNFYVTEDNYAWDMEELVAAIKAGSGVLRNPLSKQMFTPKDVKGILMHPVSKPLAALAVAQKELSKGVRPETITRMEKLSSILLEDQSADTMLSRHAVDEFLAYVATRT